MKRSPLRGGKKRLSIVGRRIGKRGGFFQHALRLFHNPDTEPMSHAEFLG